ncbi:MAG: glycoside hydrolase family 97 catalytic domain-containing protein [Prevotella sp.]|nr:glycoside hydrolase family 97 catalytic domain-containing protein [Prevotella sp.]
MKRFLLPLLALLPLTAFANEASVTSPNGKLTVTINDQGGRATYAVTLDGQSVLLPSALGFKADFGDFTQGLTMGEVKTGNQKDTYQMRQVKQSAISYDANTLVAEFQNAKKQRMSVEFFVKDNDVAFRYLIPRQTKAPFAMMAATEAMNPKCAVIEREATSFTLPDGTTTFVCPQIDPMKGWERTKPSYEEEYVPDAPMAVKSKFGQGYTFPCLFKAPLSSPQQGGGQNAGNALWVLISETGVSSQYCAAHLSDYREGTGYTIAFPQAGENNGFGSATAAIALPAETPWRTITVGQSLSPIVETTIPYDVVKPLYEPSEDYRSGRYTWSWLIWQDYSINWNDQVQFIDLAGAMGYEYCLVDGCWDTEIGRNRMAELSKYAQQKGVSLMLWYNSNGAWNNAPQTPRGCMDNSIARDREMKWLKAIGVKGIKVDFFAGDKQETMRLYEDILFDANRYGIQVIFHGCTLPRGWERMYPNFVSSEAVLASENVYFSDYHAKQEPFQLTMHPFCRNAVATMDWGGVIMNKHLSKDNKSRHLRQTTDAFELATAFTNQAAIQCIAIQPNNLQDLPQMELDFLKTIPTTWDETRLLAGYPGKYVVMARRHGDQWYIAGLNALKEPQKMVLDLNDYNVSNIIIDAVDKKTQQVSTQQNTVKKNKKGLYTVEMQPNGGMVLY